MKNKTLTAIGITGLLGLGVYGLVRYFSGNGEEPPYCIWDFPYGINQDAAAYWERTYTGETVSLLAIPIPSELVVIYDMAYTRYFIPGGTSTLTTLEKGVMYIVVVTDPLTWHIVGLA